MFADEFTAMANGARNKADLMSGNATGYFISSVMAGAFIGFGVMLAFHVSGALSGSAFAPFAKILPGISFAVALSLVIMAGAELFTGNTMVMTAGVMRGTTTTAELVKLWAVCYIGNWLGSIFIALLYWASGAESDGAIAAIAGASAAKMSVPLLPLIIRGVLCNILVCLAVWCGFRTKNDAAKLIMTFWCIYCFFSCGFEHSVANMTTLTLGLLNPSGAAVSLSGYFYNLAVVTVGNIIGGALMVGVPYGIISRK